MIEMLGDPAALAAFFQVVLIDVTLAGDNAIVVGALAAGLPRHDQRRVILIGIIAALVLRIGFALIAGQLLQVIGLVLAGGILLLWVSWRMWRELRPQTPAIPGGTSSEAVPAAKTMVRAAWAVAVADVSMSLDNVLAVAGAAREHPMVMVFGLVLSIALMGLAASFIARLIDRYRWIAYIGLGVILYVAIKMIIEGWHQVEPLII